MCTGLLSLHVQNDTFIYGRVRVLFTDEVEPVSSSEVIHHAWIRVYLHGLMVGLFYQVVHALELHDARQELAHFHHRSLPHQPLHENSHIRFQIYQQSS